ncbi:MAG: ribonuclease J [Lachnospiraceae bacterium]|nr:ribonuclease J [Lachnospiraceae bacterium]
MEINKLKSFDEYLEKNILHKDKNTADEGSSKQHKNSGFHHNKANQKNVQMNNKSKNATMPSHINKQKTKNQDVKQENNKNNYIAKNDITSRQQNKYQNRQQENSQNSYQKNISDIKNEHTFIEKMTARNRKFLEHYNPNKNAKVKIIPLGGLNAIGMNITVIEDDNDIIIIDCGNAFPTEDMLGIDLVIPDVTYLKKNFSKIRGLVLTHGHEDHIGAIPYILKELNIPIYGTKLTLALIEGKLKEHEIVGYKLNTVNFSDVVRLGNFYVEFIKTNHSIVDSAALAIYTKAGIIMHTGDFKVDYTPVFGDSIDLSHFAEIGRMGVLALLSDSTNAIKPGFTMSERTVGKIFDSIFTEYNKQRIIVSTFASNVDRVRQIIDTAARFGRKVAIEGRSMINIINIATDLGYINVPKGTLINVDMLKNYSDEKTVVITTGSQGESMAALSRMAQGTNKKVNIKKGDVVILSSTPIPGNEKAVNKIIDELYRRFATVIYQDTHVSGHACAEELKLIYTLVEPKYAIPVHGEYRHRREAANLAESVGVAKDKCLLLEVGDVLELSEDSAKVVEHVQSGGINVDGLGVGDVGSIVLKDRQNLAASGVVVIAMALNSHNSSIVSGPDIISKGFVYMKESGDLIDGLKEVVRDTVEEFKKENSGDWKKLKSQIDTAADKYLWKQIEREPLIIPIIMSV